MRDIIPPTDFPPIMKTDHGVQMSVRMARLFHFLKNNGSTLSSWSTDECVKREFRLLQQLWFYLEKSGKYPIVQRDLESIMSRVPDTRLTT